MVSPLADLVLYRSLSELRAEAKRSYAGLVWWIIRPLLSLAVYGLVFGVVFKSRETHFVVFLFSGIIAWEWFSNAVLRSANSIIASRPLMQLVRVDPALFPLSICLVDAVKFLFGLAILLLLLPCQGIVPGWTWTLIPLIMLGELLLCAGFGMFFAALVPFCPDLALVLQTVLQLLMFLSGVFYRVETLPAIMGKVLAYNPMAMVISQFRNILLDGNVPSLITFVCVWSWGLVAFVAGCCLLRRFRGIYPKRW